MLDRSMLDRSLIIARALNAITAISITISVQLSMEQLDLPLLQPVPAVSTRGGCFHPSLPPNQIKVGKPLPIGS